MIWKVVGKKKKVFLLDMLYYTFRGWARMLCHALKVLQHCATIPLLSTVNLKDQSVIHCYCPHVAVAKWNSRAREDHSVFVFFCHLIFV